MLDYRGFGRSQAGRPSMRGRRRAAALAYLRTRRVDGGRLVVLGQSLGGATALRLLARDSAGVRLAVIEAAFAATAASRATRRCSRCAGAAGADRLADVAAAVRPGGRAGFPSRAAADRARTADE